MNPDTLTQPYLKAMNRYIKVSYKMFTNSAASHKELYDSGQPVAFVTGMGLMVDGFEKRLSDMEPGTQFDFTLPPEEAFGLRDEGKVGAVPRKLFEIQGKFDDVNVFPGAEVPLQDKEGYNFLGTVVRVTETEVVIDLNSPFAGRAIQFTGTLHDNREATLQEIEYTARVLSGETTSCGGCGGCGGGHCGGCGSNDTSDRKGGCGGCGGCGDK